jgi:rhodanese-related sulfurtransferase
MIAVFVAVVAALFIGSPALAGGGVIDAVQIQQLLNEDRDGVVLLDVRTPGEFASGHMQGAMLVPMREVPYQMLNIPRNKKVVVVCATGARSGAVTKYLAEQGYPWVKNYSGGMSDWSRRGLPVAR